jgi:hypothetical protein
MIIRYLNIVSIAIAPSEAYPPTIVDPDAVLPHSITGEFLKPIPWRNRQVLKRFGCIEDRKPSQCDLLHIIR